MVKLAGKEVGQTGYGLMGMELFIAKASSDV